MRWASQEMEMANFGDQRLKNRVINLLDNLSKDPESSIPNACKDWASTKAAYRFFENKKVKLDKIIEPHLKKSIERIQKEKRVLMIQDTTEINYSSQKEKQDAGPSHFKGENVFFSHPTIAVTPDKICLGVTNIFHWYREKLQLETLTQNELRNMRLHHLDISEKESYRWLLGYRHATDIAQKCPKTHVIMVADREGDVSDIYNEAEQLNGIKADWLVRAKVPNRALLTSDGERDKELLRDKLLKKKPQSIIEFQLPNRNKSDSRKVIQEVRTLRVQMHPPTGRRGKLRLKPFWVTAILASEINVPTNEKPIEWLLLTSVELNTDIQCHDILQW